MRQSEIKKLGDGLHRASRCLYLSVSGGGVYRSWVFRKTLNGRILKHGIGSATGLTVAQAIDKTEDILRKIASGTPVDEIFKRKKHEKEEKHTLRDIVFFYLETESKRKAYKPNSRTVDAKKGQFERYLPEKLKAKDIRCIEQEEIIEALSPVCESTMQVGSIVRNVVEKSYDLAMVKKWFKGENPARWNGCLEYLIPKNLTKKHHQKAMTLDQIKTAVKLLQTDERVNEATRKAIIFGILTSTRIIEFSKSTWDEINFEDRTWSVDPSHRKGKHIEPFVVPLSDQAIELLNSIPKESTYIFKPPRTEFISQPQVTPILKKVTGNDCTMHGCRSTFRDWCAETGVERDVAEVSLSHRVGENETERSYYRTKFFEKRRKVMQDWADEIFPSNIDISI